MRIKNVLKILFLLSNLSALATPIDEPLRTMESEHFRYIYQESLSARMPAFVKNCEDAYTILTPVFHWEPEDKTVVMYFDAYDVHNGWATVFPRPTMMIYAADSPIGTTIYEPGDYVRRTIFHEFAHILTMGPQYGVDGILASILGRWIPTVGDPLSFALFLLSLPPGAAAPTWYLEGLATWAETEFVGPGRGRNSRVDMMFRTAVADDRLLPGNQWALEHPEWPYGNATYIYGLKVIEYIHDNISTEEKNVPGDLADSVSRSFMYKFNNRSKDLAGKEFSELSVEAMKIEKERQQKRIAELEKQPFTELPRLTPENVTVSSPKFGPNGRTIIMAGMENTGRDTLYQYNLDDGQLKRLRSVRTGSPVYTALATSRDHRNVYYTRLNYQCRESVRNELHKIDAVTGATRTVVTRKGRYRYPAVYDNTLAAVVNKAGCQSLVTVPLSRAGNANAETRVVNAAEFENLVNPVFSPDGKSLVYVNANKDVSQIRKINLETAKDELIHEESCIIVSPVFHPAGKDLVFVSDANGVYNLYRISLDNPKKPVALTHMLGGVFQPDFSVDGKQLAVAGYDSYGYYLSFLDYEKMLLPDVTLPVLKSDWKELPQNRKKCEMVAETEPQEDLQSRDYSSLATMRFDGWTPWLTASEDAVYGGLAAGFSDPADYQELVLLGGVESEYSTPLANVIYQCSAFYPIFTLYGQSAVSTYTDILRNDRDVYYDYTEEVQGGGAAITLPWNRADWQGALVLGGSYYDRSLIEDSRDDYRNENIVQSNQFEGAEASLWAKALLFTGTAYRKSHSVEDGRYVSVSAAYSDENMGGDLSRTRLRADWIEYVPVPYLDNHVLRLEGVYAKASGDETLQGSFGLGQSFGLAVDVPGLERNIGLRGYGANWQVGDEVIKSSIAYRLPLFRLYRGVNTTFPLYMHQVFGEVFYEFGKADGIDPVTKDDYDWINSAGAELNFGMTLGRFLRLSPGIGVVYAFDYEERKHDEDDDEDDETDKLQVYLTIKSVINF